jgi:hypothetical protein
MSENWVPIANAANDEEAALIRGFLESEGIEARLDDRNFHMAPTNSEDLVLLRIVTSPADAPRARQLLQKREHDFDILEDSGDESSLLTDSGPADPAEEPK